MSEEISPIVQKYLATQSPTPDYSPAERLGLGAMTAIPKALQGFSSVGTNIAHAVGLIDPETEGTWVPPEVNLPPGQTTGEKLADFGAGLMPMAVQLAATGGASRALGGAMGLSSTGATQRILSDAIGFGALGASEDLTTGAEQTGEGAALGALGMLPRSSPTRIIGSAALGLGSKLFFDRNGATPVAGNFSRGDLSGVAQGLMGAFVGGPAAKFVTDHRPGSIPTKVATVASPNPMTMGTVEQTAARNAILEGAPVGSLEANLGIHRMPRSAEESAQAMQRAWGMDPAATGNPVELDSVIANPMGKGLTETSPLPIGKSAEESATAIQELIKARQEANSFLYSAGPQAEAPSSQLPLSPIQERLEPQLAGIRAEDSAQVLAKAAQQRELEILKDEAGGAILNFKQKRDAGLIYESHESKLARLQAEGKLILAHDAPAATSQPALPVENPFAIVPARPATEQILDPANVKLGGVPVTPGVGNNLQQLQMAMITNDARATAKNQAIELAKWQAGLSERPPVGADELWQKITTPEPKLQTNPLLGDKPINPPLASSPSAEGTIINQPKGKLGDIVLRNKLNEGGFASHELTAALGRATVGGLVGGTAGALVDDPDTHVGLVTGMVGGALLASFGPSMIKSALKDHVNRTTILPAVTPLNAATQGTAPFSLQKLISEAQLNVGRNTASLGDRTLARLDNWFQASRGETMTRILGQSAGPAHFFTSMIDDAFRKLGYIQVDDIARNATSEFLRGNMTEAAYQAQMAHSPTTKAYSDFAIVARRGEDGLQELVSRGLGSTGRAQMVLDSRGKYLTQSYKMFVDPTFVPTDQATTDLANKILATGEWNKMSGGVSTAPSIAQVQDGLRQYVQDIKKAKGVYRPDAGKTIDQTLFAHKKILNDEWKAFLGEITDPVDRIRLTTLKLKPAAEASNFLHTIATGSSLSDEGLAFTFNTHGELEAERAAVLQRLQSTPSDVRLQRQLLELQQYQYIAPDASKGALQGKYVHRNVHNVMTDWDAQGGVDNAAMRAYSGLNSMMKANVTYRNPMGIVRQVISAPFFLQIGRGFSHAGEAVTVLRDANHPMYKELMDNGILGADTITKDVLRDVDHLSGGLSTLGTQTGAKVFLGRIDQMIGKASTVVKEADSKMADWFRFPDNVVRAATYMSAKARFAEEMGLSLTDQAVVNRAVEHTNRYTMNYANLSPAVQLGRKVPFVNMFISYTAEMGRIMKNLGEDLIKGDGAARMNAAMALATMVAIPEALQSGSESQLSGKDKADWDKVKAGLPDYLKNRYMFVQGRDAKTGKFRVYDFSNLLPADQFQQVGRALSKGNIGDAVAINPVAGWDNNPALNIASAMITGKDRFTGRALRGTSDKVATVAKELGGPNTPGLGSNWRAASLAFSTNAEGGTGITDKRGRSMTPADLILPWITSVKAQNIDLNVIQQSAISDYKGRVANEMAYYNDVRKSNAPKEAKERAAARTREALQQLQDNLKNHLGFSPSDQPE